MDAPDVDPDACSDHHLYWRFALRVAVLLFFLITLGLESSDTSLKYEPSSEQLLITAKQLWIPMPADKTVADKTVADKTVAYSPTWIPMPAPITICFAVWR